MGSHTELYTPLTFDYTVDFRPVANVNGLNVAVWPITARI